MGRIKPRGAEKKKEKKKVRRRVLETREKTEWVSVSHNCECKHIERGTDESAMGRRRVNSWLGDRSAMHGVAHQSVSGREFSLIKNELKKKLL